MNLIRLLLFVALLPASAFVVAQDAPAKADGSAVSPSPDPRIRGAQVFGDSGCHQCHTVHRTGGTKGPDLSGVGRRLNESQIRSQILGGGKQMPPFAGVLQLTETDDLVAYLRSLRDKEKTK
jgi:mono/diheme cytochrome c family protein